MIAQQLQPCIAIAVLTFECLQARLRARPLTVGLGDSAALRTQATKFVEQVALRGGSRERLKLMLSVHIEQFANRIAQYLQGDRLAVEKGARAAVCGDDAPYQQFTVVLDGLIGQHGRQGGAGLCQIEGGAYLCTFSAGAPLGDPKVVPYALAVGDLNLDGKVDIVVGHVQAPSTVYFNDGTGRQFTPVSFGDNKGTVYGFAIGDLDEDGRPDIAAARSEAPNVLYFGDRGRSTALRVIRSDFMGGTRYFR